MVILLCKQPAVSSGCVVRAQYIFRLQKDRTFPPHSTLGVVPPSRDSSRTVTCVKHAISLTARSFVRKNGWVPYPQVQVSHTPESITVAANNFVVGGCVLQLLMVGTQR